MFLKIHIFLDELRGKAVEEPKNVMDNKHLAVTVYSCPDTDGRYVKHPVNFFGKGRRNHLDHDRECSGVLDSPSISEDLFPGRLVLALDLEAAEHVRVLGSQADMGHNRNARVHDRPDRLGHLGPALKLDRLCTGF